jgi:allantoin racemase
MRIMALSQTSEGARDPARHEHTEALLRSYAATGTVVDFCYPDLHVGDTVAAKMGAQNARTELHYLVSTPALVQKIVWAEEAGYDAVVVANAFDPGVEAGRFAVRIPVIGQCRTSLLLAAGIAERIGITVPYDGYALHVQRLLRAYRLEPFVVDIRSLALKGAGRTQEVVASHQDVLGEVTGMMRSIIAETGADCIVPLGAAVIPYVVSPRDLQAELGIPVLNPTQIAIRHAEMCVQLGVSHSPGAYAAGQFTSADFRSVLASEG